MTAVSGEIWCACFKTSMPLALGMRISVTTTSYNADSILDLAASPEFTVSTRWPSRRSVMSRSSQMERSSSATRMLPTSTSFVGTPPVRTCGCGAGGYVQHDASRARGFGCLFALVQCLVGFFATQEQAEIGPAAGAGSCCDSSVMCLHNLVDNGESQTRADMILILEGLKNAQGLLLCEGIAGVGNLDFPTVLPIFHLLQRYSQRASLGHASQGVVAQIPKGLPQSSSITCSPSLLGAE